VSCVHPNNLFSPWVFSLRESGIRFSGGYAPRTPIEEGTSSVRSVTMPLSCEIRVKL
jgi:hypothetical protein